MHVEQQVLAAAEARVAALAAEDATRLEALLPAERLRSSPAFAM